MKVKELISKVKPLDENLEIYCYYESSDAIRVDEMKILGIDDIDVANGVMSRDPETRHAQMAFNAEAVGATRVALVGITLDL